MLPTEWEKMRAQDRGRELICKLEKDDELQSSCNNLLVIIFDFDNCLLNIHQSKFSQEYILLKNIFEIYFWLRKTENGIPIWKEFAFYKHKKLVTVTYTIPLIKSWDPFCLYFQPYPIIQSWIFESIPINSRLTFNFFPTPLYLVW